MPSISTINKTLLSIPPSGIRRFFDLVAQSQDIISLGVGEPDFITPWHVREACIFSLERGQTHYTSNLGQLELRREIAIWLKRKYSLKYAEDEILVTNGVSEGFDLAIRTLLNPGDEVIVPAPAYVMYEPLVRLAGGVVCFAEGLEKNNLVLKCEDIEKKITKNTKVLILSYPGNPTGQTLNKIELQKIAKLVKKHDLFVISDEIYSELSYDSIHVSFASLPEMRERTITLNGFSKAFAMTGLRLGFICAPRNLLGEILKIHQYCALCASSIAQAGAIEALRNGAEEVQKMKEEYDARRKLVLSACKKIGLVCPYPDGAFYIFPSIKKTGLSGEEFALQLLKKFKVAVVPGNVFGKNYADHIRISYATGMEDLVEAFKRIEEFVRGGGK